MASSDEPFLKYLTVFRSRLGALNLVLDSSSIARQPEQAFKRRVRQFVDSRSDVCLSEAGSEHVLDYLADKKLIGPRPRSSGRYRGWSLRRETDGWKADFNERSSESVPVYKTDIWLSDMNVPSTIGAPTTENVEEIVDLAFQFRMIDRNKFSWSATGHLVNALHAFGGVDESANPFILRSEAPVFLRSLLEEDGRFQLCLLRFLAGRGAGSSVKRDEVADALPDIATQALELAWPSKLSPKGLSEGKKVISTLKGAPGNGSGPGVREHRSSPRLEWLTDLGYLSKEGLPRNAFEYKVTPQLVKLSDSLTAGIAEGNDWAFATALHAWRENPTWSEYRRIFSCDDPTEAFRLAYKLLRRPIGPVPLRDVSFATGMLCGSLPTDDVVASIIEIVQNVPGASLSGGRYDRRPENVYLPESVVKGFTG